MNLTSLFAFALIIFTVAILIGAAFRATLDYWPVTDRLNRKLKEFISMAVTLVIMASLALITLWIDARISGRINSLLARDNRDSVSSGTDISDS